MAPSPCYILAASAISPQQSFAPESFLQPLESSSNNRLYVQEAPYNQYIAPVAIRRMSRMLKFSISTAMKAYKDAGGGALAGILTGTGNGSVGDMEQFLSELLARNEDTLNPTAFIQSTYNSPNGWIAMQTKCEGYNQCFLHRGVSFELALFDAQLLLQEATDATRLLAGCYDELTERYYIIKEKADYWKKETIESSQLFQHSHTPGTIAGEGAAFFMLSNQPENALAQLKGLHILQDHQDADAIATVIENALNKSGLTPQDISLVLSGENGDCRNRDFYEAAYAPFPEATIAGFKHLCGEYDTATGFGLWTTMQILQFGKVPEEMVLREGKKRRLQASAPQHILIVNKAIRGGSTVLVVGR